MSLELQPLAPRAAEASPAADLEALLDAIAPRRPEPGRISQAVGKLSEAPILIDDTPGLSPLLLRAKARMRNWLIGQSLLMLSLGTCSLIVYWALGLKYFYLLAMFAGVANILPIEGGRAWGAGVAVLLAGRTYERSVKGGLSCTALTHRPQMVGCSA